MFPGFGTLLNVAAILVGASLGALLGQRLPTRTRDVVTDALGLVTLLVAATSAGAVLAAEFAGLVGDSATVLVVLGALLIGGILGSLLRIEARLEGLGAVLQRRLGGRESAARSIAAGTPSAETERHRFIEGFVSASLVFCVGPLTILGALSDGLGRGIDQLALKSVLDGFAAIAFAASFGWGVAASALTVLVVQGAITLLGVGLGGLLPDGHVAAITATGGLLLVGVALRLLRIRPIPVGDLLPALVVAPLLAQLVASLR
jgi:uncharacterized membrane protein YqgA involved in biofilm formation